MEKTIDYKPNKKDLLYESDLKSDFESDLKFEKFMEKVLKAKKKFKQKEKEKQKMTIEQKIESLMERLEHVSWSIKYHKKRMETYQSDQEFIMEMIQNCQNQFSSIKEEKNENNTQQ